MNVTALRTPTAREADQLAIYKHGLGVELGAIFILQSER